MTGVQPGYGQYCPISRALEVVGDRWTLLIVRDLLLGTRRFSDLARGLPGLSRALLTRRLRQLEAAGLLERRDGGYHPTEAGWRLEPIVFGLGDWGAHYAFGAPRPAELDADLLVWWMHDRLDAAALGRPRATVVIAFTDDPRRYRIALEDGGASMAVAGPAGTADLTIEASLAALYEVWLGRLSWPDAVAAGLITARGDEAMLGALPGLLRLSPTAHLVRQAGEDARRRG